ncbi:MAG: bifunctional precorrin-2 dehydrogenase/sirohydrochlorin ferrochelatase, partial [Actinomycetota bacterium]
MQFPINLNLAGRRVLLVGGGRIALRKAQQLLACGADLTVVSPDVVDEFLDMGITLVSRRYETGDVVGFRLVVTATGNVSVDQQIFDEC